MVSVKKIALMLTTACIASACTDTPVAPPDVIFPETNVSFNTHVKPVLLNNCAISGCHDGYSADPENPSSTIFRLETHNDVISSGIVSTIEPERSRLAMVLRGELLHPNDPYFLALNENQRNGIIQWIREGVANN